MAVLSPETDRDIDYEEHERTYRGFVKGVLLFTAHVLLILALLAYFLG